MQIHAVLSLARQRLARVGETPALDAQVLLAHLLGKPRAWLLAHSEAELASEEFHNFTTALDRLAGGEPLPYLIGHWEFFGLDLLVTPAVLIPRPETELLVETALRWLHKRFSGAAPEPQVDFPATRSKPAPAGPARPLLAADIGTGSGCIAAALAVHAPQLRLVATDLSWPALQVARSNLSRHGLLDRIHLVQADLLCPFATSSPPFDLICANLPYIPTAILRDLPVAYHEPVLALHGGVDGLDPLRVLLAAAPHRLAEGGRLLLEIEAGQGLAALELAHRAFPDAEIQLMTDMAGRDRVLSVMRH